jgi:histidine kinase 2/3/4 (cytokinin receptor)
MQEDRENIMRARATGKAVLTSPFRLLGSHHLGVVLTFPVYKSKLPPNPTTEELIKATAGYYPFSLLFWLVSFFSLLECFYLCFI